jgi:two-component system, cell cycle response regulator
VLIDPGSPLTIDGTLAKLRAITDLDAIRWLVCHHSDPDICAALPRLGRCSGTLTCRWSPNGVPTP